ncbi:hypothetical protein [Vibrio mexicanus]|uniref:hypothetical protein n=1 Tax=Vibrio mexicanus TaxID=1004326 RepID=UPI0012F99345|nr:hypothetical protein [Vibrio mexicanus]
MVILLLTIACSFSAHSNEYIVIINGEEHAINLDSTVNFKVDEMPVSLTLKRNSEDTRTFTSEAFSFKHPARFLPAREMAASGRYITGMLSPLGSNVTILEFKNNDPRDFFDGLVNITLSDDRAENYKITESPTFVRLYDGTKLHGKRFRVVQRNNKIVEKLILYYAKDDSGIIISTAQSSKDHKDMVDEFYKSLIISM